VLPVLKVSSLSTGEVLTVPVSAKVGGVAEDVTAYPVESALVAGDATKPTAWSASAWETDTTLTPTVYRAIHVVGSLSAGTYAWWLRVTAPTGYVVFRVALVEVD
jgi:hypothetical protein